MKWSDFKMRSKLFTLASVGILGLLLVGIMGTLDLKHANNDLGRMNRTVQKVTNFSELKIRLLMARLDIVYMMALEDMSKVTEKYDDYNTQVQTIRGLIKETEKTELSAEEKGFTTTFKDGAEAYFSQGTKLGDQLIAAHKRQDKSAIAAVTVFGSQQVAPLYDKPAEAIDALNRINVKRGAETFREADSSARQEIIVNALIILAAIVASAVISLLITRGITAALRDVFDTMAAIADGDLTARSAITSRDEMGMLGQEINVMGERLGGIVRGLSDNSHSVSSAAIQMHATSEQMATSTEELAAQASTIATACEEMSATSSDIARNCHAAAADSARANDAALNGARVVDETVDVMSRIAARVRVTAHTVETLGSRSDQIGEIIGTIEDIADQTNLLALNAAIEAARAGDQGRGFAVVADEVRALAERTTTATREIGQMIKSIQAETKSAVTAMDEGVREVEQGTVEAAKSGEALRQILAQIANVSGQINQIAVAAEQQTSTNIEINENIQQISVVAGVTSTSGHEEAATANELARLAEELRSVVGQFKY